MARKIPKIRKPKTKLGWIDKIFAGLGGISTLVKHPNLYQSMSGATKSGSAAKAAQLAKYGKWGVRGMGLLNPWTAVPFGLMSLAQYGVGKAFDPYRDETGKIGAEGHAQLASAARARENLMARRNEARESGAGFWDIAKMRAKNGGLASILRYYG